MTIKRNSALILVICMVISGIFAFFVPVNIKDAVFASQQEKEKKITSAKSMIVIERDSQRVLYEYNSQEKLPMASTTKIITAIFAIERNEDLDKKIVIPKEATKIEGTSIGLIEGEELTIRELLYGLMLRSGNDSAVALALATSGSMENYIKDINEFLKEKGINNTYIKNPHGLPDDEHYTTASDLAKITAYALKNETFKEIVSTKNIKISDQKKSKISRNLVNKNRMLKELEYADGVKTGYTKKAGRCFVGSATKDNMQVICVLLNCVPMFEECEQLINRAFEEYKLTKILTAGDTLKTINIENSKTQNVQLNVGKDVYFPLKEGEVDKISINIKSGDSIKAPIAAGTPIAEVEISLENQLIFSNKIYTIKEIESNNLISNIIKITDKM